MEPPLALHTAARRFCERQHARWHAEYSPLARSGGDRAGMEYTPAAYRLFPRYRLDEDIQAEIEKISSEKLPALEELRGLMRDAGRQAFTALAREYEKHPEAVVALDEEWNAFDRHIANLDDRQLESVEPMPFRRVLTESEGERLRQRLTAQWGVEGYWHPIAKVDPRLNVVAFHEELWGQRSGTALLLRALEERAVGRCFALPQIGPDYELDRALVTPIYREHETFVTSDCEWLIYSSHESSITVAGWLADIFRLQWPDWAQITYQGVFHTEDLRGTWGGLHIHGA